MPRMQTKDIESDVSTREVGNIYEERFLEGPDRVVLGISPCLTTVYTGGVAVATLRVGMLQPIANIESENPLFRVTVHRFDELNWTHRGSMLKLQGENIANILGTAACLLRGIHRPIYHPRPGIDGVELIVIDLNPTGLPISEIFKLVKQRGF